MHGHRSTRLLRHGAACIVHVPNHVSLVWGESPRLLPSRLVPWLKLGLAHARLELLNASPSARAGALVVNPRPLPATVLRCRSAPGWTSSTAWNARPRWQQVTVTLHCALRHVNINRCAPEALRQRRLLQFLEEREGAFADIEEAGVGEGRSRTGEALCA